MNAKRTHQAFQVVFLIAALLIVPATITLRTVVHPGVLSVPHENPTPLGYAVSMLLFLIPLGALGWWFSSRADLRLQRKAFWRTIGVLAPLGFVLDLLFGNAFFMFPNTYFTYLTAASIIPSAGFFHTAQPFINWRAFSFTFFLILLISLLWEVTLAIPYGWWGYHPQTMMGLSIGAWSGLPVEAVCVWLAVSFTTVITYEVLKIWKALGTGALEAFFGIRK